MSDEAQATAVTRVDTPRGRARTARPDTVHAARLGHFQLLDVIGTGGMGTVYAAYDLNLDRKVAIKVLQDDGDEPETPEQTQQRNQRFLREAQAMAKLSHPNVVPIYEVGADGGTVFLAMEYVAGEPLDGWLRKKPSWRTIVGVFVQAGRGLSAAHAAGIVHRDFKPANVLIDEGGNARETDFGIALIQAHGDYGRMVRLGDGTIACVYDCRNKMWIRHSRDEGKSWGRTHPGC
jgi:serine/threonine protein kinase